MGTDVNAHIPGCRDEKPRAWCASARNQTYHEGSHTTGCGTPGVQRRCRLTCGLCNRRVRLLDAFMANDEVAMVWYRLQLHAPLAARTLISESLATHAGRPKRAYVAEALSAADLARHNIRLLTVPRAAMFSTPNCSARRCAEAAEMAQRTSLNWPILEELAAAPEIFRQRRGRAPRSSRAPRASRTVADHDCAAVRVAATAPVYLWAAVRRADALNQWRGGRLVALCARRRRLDSADAES